ncbi:unnamed protein product [Lactuca saligna]|uniref:Uncharacterized protein n=1 Tax=Lactuca saligna TaxID=75948 RepID=A0AA36EDA3_LACSI|nr:unnamed protein product [Lactuca saligna]
MKLKFCLTNYAVKNGYKLYYEKNDGQRLLVRCCKDSKNPSCPFRLWASWMSSERSFRIKSLVDDHNCSRVFKLGSIVTYKWIGKRFKNQLLKNPKMSIRKMKSKMSTKFNLIVSVTQSRNARRYALDEIEGSLIEHYGKVWSYGEEIMRTNPSSTVKTDVNVMPDSTTYFSKMNWSWIDPHIRPTQGIGRGIDNVLGTSMLTSRKDSKVNNIGSCFGAAAASTTQPKFEAEMNSIKN